MTTLLEQEIAERVELLLDDGPRRAGDTLVMSFDYGRLSLEFALVVSDLRGHLPVTQEALVEAFRRVALEQLGAIADDIVRLTKECPG